MHNKAQGLRRIMKRREGKDAKRVTDRKAFLRPDTVGVMRQRQGFINRL